LDSIHIWEDVSDPGKFTENAAVIGTALLNC
jgi:hypothetical protein